MKRNLFCSVLALCLVVALTACGGQKDAPASGAATPNQGGTQSTPQSGSQSTPQSSGPEAYVFQSGNTSIAIDDDMAGVLAALGEPQSYFEAASCAFDGLDKTYTYPGFIISTRPDGEHDFINSILLTDDSVTTPEGLYIGSSLEDVTAVYGEGETTDTLFTYTKGNTTMNFLIQDGKIISIEYLPA